MERTTTVDVCGARDGRIIKAKEDGGCCVARKTVVHVYDWMLKQQAALNLDYGVVTDVAFMGAEIVLIGSDDRDTFTGGMACFDVASREVVHRYEEKHDGQLREFEVTDIATDNGEHVFCSLQIRSRNSQIYRL